MIHIIFSLQENVEFCINPADKISSLKGCIQDLNKYKVLGVLGKVLLVLDISSNTTFVVKVRKILKILFIKYIDTFSMKGNLYFIISKKSNF